MPITRPSDSAMKLTAVIRLFRHFIAWPAPSGPRWNTARPITSSSGRTRSTSIVSPPTMKTSSACSAPHCAPETGASTIATPTLCEQAPGFGRQPGFGRRRVEQQRARPEAGKQAVRSGDEVAHDLAVRHHREHDVAAPARRQPARPAPTRRPGSTRAARPGPRARRTAPARDRLSRGAIAIGSPMTPRPMKPMRVCVIMVVQG